MPETIDRATGQPIQPIGWQGHGLDFELMRVPGRPSQRYRWNAYLGATSVEHGWAWTRPGAYVAMWICAWRWRKWPRRG